MKKQNIKLLQCKELTGGNSWKKHAHKAMCNAYLLQSAVLCAINLCIDIAFICQLHQNTACVCVCDEIWVILCFPSTYCIFGNVNKNSKKESHIKLEVKEISFGFLVTWVSVVHV